MTIAEIFRGLRNAFSAKTLLVGVVVGFAGMCVLGRQAARENLHKDFVRFTAWIGPDTKYYPTVNEMIAIVRAKAKPAQTLVIVGGNSILYGVGQTRDQVWTKRLQEELGADYAVINFAFRGSIPTDGGAVVAEALRHEYPRQIYIANAAPTQHPTPDGSGVYRFIFWDAYYKNLLLNDSARAAAIAESHKHPVYREGMDEIKLRERLDRLFYFHDFWNDVAYARLSTVWGPYTPGLTKFLRARKHYPDPEPDLLTFPMSSRYIEANLEVELLNVRGCSMYAFEPTKDADGKWKLYAPVWDQFNEHIKGAFPQELKKRTLILMSRNSPYYIRRLPADEQERDDLAYLHAVKMWKEGGYDSIDYGKDFTIDDYGDRTHLTSLGGAKLAKMVAVKVREMSKNLGYLQP